MILRILQNVLILCIAISCCHNGEFSTDELKLINNADSIMRVLTTESTADMAVLRAKSTDLSADALVSEDFERLAELMIATVTHPSQDGVGIAGPQVGINRRVVAVQRFDKDGEPFEIYPNVNIVWASDSLVLGPEGCLSVPDMRGNVLRSAAVVIEYADMKALKSGCKENIPVIRDTVQGFSAVIFQHETDHLDGVLYIDKL